MNIIVINVGDLVDRIGYCFSITQEERRWLAIKAGLKIKEKELRCKQCNETGYVKSVPTIEECSVCHGKGRYTVPEPSYIEDNVPLTQVWSHYD